MRLRLFGPAAGVLLLLSCGYGSNSPYGGGGGGGGTCMPTSTKVCMIGRSFSQTNLMISAGQTVTWDNGSSEAHTVTSSSTSTETFDSGSVAPGGTFTHMFPAAGTYHYYCQFHGIDGNPPTGMAGTITVN